MNYSIKLEFLTPCFSHGATDAPEIRPASIRGMLHHWFRILGGTPQQERLVFGGVNQGRTSPFHDDSASRVVIRVRHDAKADWRTISTLPHKTGERASPRAAFAPGHAFELLVSDRLGGLKEPEASLFRDALYVWLLMGTLGFRSTRAAGSFTFQSDDFPQPASPEAYLERCKTILAAHRAPTRVGLSGKAFDKAEDARRLVSDSLGGPANPDHAQDLERLHDPLGKIGRSGERRKTSPLKYRLVRFDGKFHILATWDGRRNVTGNDLSDLTGVIDLLLNRKPELGRVLAQTRIDV